MSGKNGHNGLSGKSHDFGDPLVLMPDGRSHSIKLNGADGNHVPINLSATQACATQQLEFRRFPDGTIVELVRDPNDPADTALLIWKNMQATIQKTFRYCSTEFVPRLLEPSLMEAIRLPVGILPYGSLERLTSEMHRCLSEYLDVGNDQLRLISLAVLCTWFPDRIPVAPYLWIVGPYSAGKTTLLRLLHALCRRGITVSDFTPACLYSLPGMVLPTLLIDEFECGRNTRDRDLLRLLRTGSTQGGQVIRGSKVYKTFGVKIVASRQSPTDVALASRGIFVVLRPTRRTFPLLDDVTLESIADYFQPRLLNYRLRHHSQVGTNPRAEMPDFTPRMKDLARALAVPLLGDATKEKELFKLLAPHDKEARLNRHGEPEWAVATALFHDGHQSTTTLTVGDLAVTVCQVLAANGETYELKPRAVGETLRALGLSTEKLGNEGRGLRLTRSVRHQIHQLARDMGLKRSDLLRHMTVEAGYGGLSCALCEDYGLMICEDGKRLRGIPLKRPRGSGLYART